jgi:hypothetical protein
LAPYFLGWGACEGAIVEGMRDGCFSAIAAVGLPLGIGREYFAYLSFSLEGPRDPTLR